MKEELEEILFSKNPDVFQDWIDEYPKSNCMQLAVEKRDSLQLHLALGEQRESAIDAFIKSHESSKYLNQALQIKEEMVRARELYDKAKVQNSVQGYELFLEKFPKSLHNTDAHRGLLNAAEKIALESSSSEVMAKYIIKYLMPNSSFCNPVELKGKKEAIFNALDNQLIKESVNPDIKKSYESYSKLWIAYQRMKMEIPNEYSPNLPKTYSYKTKIADILFVKLLESDSEQKQKVLKEKLNLDFPKFNENNPQEDPFITIINLQKNGTGNLKLFNLGYMRSFFDNMPEGNSLIGRSLYEYKGENYSCLIGVNYEEIAFNRGVIFGTVKCFINKQLDFMFNMGQNGPTEISYYQSGKLVKTTYVLANYDEYSYEFENGVNISLKHLEGINSRGKALVKEGLYDEAIQLLQEAINNKYPSTTAQNIELKKSLGMAVSKKEEFIKKQQAKRLAEEKRIAAAEAEKKKPIVLKDYYDLWYNADSYKGRYVQMIVTIPYGMNSHVFHQRDRSTSTDYNDLNYYRDTYSYKKTTTESNYKYVTEVTTGNNINISIPDRFFDENLIPPQKTRDDAYRIVVIVHGDEQYQLEKVERFRY